MRALGIVLAICFAAASISAQRSGSTLTGTVFLDNKPVEGAVVELQRLEEPAQKFTARTDSLGVYRFENLTAGR